MSRGGTRDAQRRVRADDVALRKRAWHAVGGLFRCSGDAKKDRSAGVRKVLSAAVVAGAELQRMGRVITAAVEKKQ